VVCKFFRGFSDFILNIPVEAVNKNASPKAMAYWRFPAWLLMIEIYSDIPVFP
jgi:hypothetical protein